MTDDTGDGTRLPEVFLQPALALTYHGIGVRLFPHQGRIRQLPIVMPLEQVDLRDAHRLAGTPVPRDDVQCQVVPRRRASSRNETARRIGETQIGLGVEAYLWVLPPEEVLISPVSGLLTSSILASGSTGTP